MVEQIYTYMSGKMIPVAGRTYRRTIFSHIFLTCDTCFHLFFFVIYFIFRFVLVCLPVNLLRTSACQRFNVYIILYITFIYLFILR